MFPADLEVVVGCGIWGCSIRDPPERFRTLQL